MNNVLWALCPWFEESGDDLVHPDDLVSIREFRPYGVVFRVTGQEGGYTEIAYSDKIFRVRDHFLRIIEPKKDWLFSIGETVLVRGRDCSGTIVGIGWHHKEEKPTFGLMVDGKRKSKRYWPEDLERI